MKTYFLFLRAINVGGHNMIKMADLTLWMQQVGCTNVKTYLQSGNVIFNSNENYQSNISAAIRQKIQHETGLNIPCLIRNLEELKFIHIILKRHQAEKPPQASLFVTLLSAQAPAKNIDLLRAVKSQPDSFTAYGSEIILEIQTPFHKTKLSNNLLERILQVDATTRSMNTIEALLAMTLKS